MSIRHRATRPGAPCSSRPSPCAGTHLMTTSVSVSVLYRGSLIVIAFFLGGAWPGPSAPGTLGSGIKPLPGKSARRLETRASLRRGRDGRRPAKLEGSLRTRWRSPVVTERLEKTTLIRHRRRVARSCSDRTCPASTSSRELRLDLGQPLRPVETQVPISTYLRVEQIAEQSDHEQLCPDTTRHDCTLIRYCHHVHRNSGTGSSSRWSSPDPPPPSSPVWAHHRPPCLTGMDVDDMPAHRTPAPRKL